MLKFIWKYKGPRIAKTVFKIIEQNFLEFDLSSLPTVPTTFVSNLPYESAADILDKVLAWPYFKTAVFMFQKEHASKIRAQAGEEFYGPLAIFSQLRARISPICKVGRSCFAPPPKVESAVLAFEKITPPDILWEKLRHIVQVSFLHRRKTWLNALLLGGYEKEKIAAALAANGLPQTVRPEEISPQQFVALSKQL